VVSCEENESRPASAASTACVRLRSCELAEESCKDMPTATIPSASTIIDTSSGHQGNPASSEWCSACRSPGARPYGGIVVQILLG
jgi:hypothetical protein